MMSYVAQESATASFGEISFQLSGRRSSQDYTSNMGGGPQHPQNPVSAQDGLSTPGQNINLHGVVDLGR